jgi:hypothetical protein
MGHLGQKLRHTAQILKKLNVNTIFLSQLSNACLSNCSGTSSMGQVSDLGPSWPFCLEKTNIWPLLIFGCFKTIDAKK